jgi:hypothetical protein
VNQKKRKVGSKLGKQMGVKAGSQWMRTERSERKQKVHRLFHKPPTVLHSLIQRSTLRRHESSRSETGRMTYKIC